VTPLLDRLAGSRDRERQHIGNSRAGVDHINVDSYYRAVQPLSGSDRQAQARNRIRAVRQQRIGSAIGRIIRIQIRRVNDQSDRSSRTQDTGRSEVSVYRKGIRPGRKRKSDDSVTVGCRQRKVDRWSYRGEVDIVAAVLQARRQGEHHQRDDAHFHRPTAQHTVISFHNFLFFVPPVTLNGAKI